MKISIIVPTYNRAELLQNALQSLAEADTPFQTEIEILVVDNNSNDDTKVKVDNFFEVFKNKKYVIKYFFEPEQGKSFAVNKGILESKGELISILDDDMQIAADWFLQVEKVFSERWNEIDFIGGKVFPIWKGEAPAKIVSAMQSVIAVGDHGDCEWEFGADTPILSGGHAVIKREVFEQTGLFPVELGPKGGNLIGCEDDIFYANLLKTNKKGIYFPQLHFYHFVPPYRLSKTYFRQWCFGVGQSWQLMDLYYQFFKEVKLLSVPRYMYRDLLKNIFVKITAFFTRNEERSMEAEKGILLFSGFFYGGNIKGTKLDQTLQKLYKLAAKPFNR